MLERDGEIGNSARRGLLYRNAMTKIWQMNQLL